MYAPQVRHPTLSYTQLAPVVAQRAQQAVQHHAAAARPHQLLLSSSAACVPGCVQLLMLVVQSGSEAVTTGSEESSDEEALLREVQHVLQGLLWRPLQGAAAAGDPLAPAQGAGIYDRSDRSSSTGSPGSGSEVAVPASTVPGLSVEALPSAGPVAGGARPCYPCAGSMCWQVQPGCMPVAGLLPSQLGGGSDVQADAGAAAPLSAERNCSPVQQAASGSYGSSRQQLLLTGSGCSTAELAALGLTLPGQDCPGVRVVLQAGYVVLLDVDLALMQHAGGVQARWGRGLARHPWVHST
jgi:hypothetical protein